MFLIRYATQIRFSRINNRRYTSEGQCGAPKVRLTDDHHFLLYTLNFEQPKGGTVQRLAILLLIVVCILAGCNGGSATQQAVATTAPTDLVQQAAANARSLNTLKMSIERTGADYVFESQVGSVIFNHLDAQY